MSKRGTFVPKIHSAQDSSEAGPSGSRRVLNRNDARLKTQDKFLGRSSDSFSSSLAEAPICHESPVTGDCDCIIGRLIKTSFLKRNAIDRLDIFFRGRPMPPSILLEDDNDFIEFYKRCNWICVCVKLERLFCWTCLLFNTDIISWNLLLNYNNTSLLRFQATHEHSNSHCSAVFKLRIFQTTSASSHQTDSFGIKYNQFVSKKRLVTTCHIRMVCYLTQQKLHLIRSADERSDEFSELLEFIKYSDPFLNSITKEIFMKIVSQNYLLSILQSIYDSVLEFIKKDLSDARYLTIIMEEIKSSAEQIKLASVLRYADKGGMVHERFIGFSDISKDTRLVHHVNGLLEKYSNGKTLIGLSFTGPSIFGGNWFLLDQIKLRHEGVSYIHSYSHNSLHTISTFIYNYQESNLFFTILMQISKIFSKLHNKKCLDEWKNCEISWNYDSNLVHNVFKHRKKICSKLEHLLKSKSIDQEIILIASGIISYMKKLEFFAFLIFFNEVFSIEVPILELCTDGLLDFNQYMRNIDRFVEGMDNLISRLPSLWADIIIEACLTKDQQRDDQLRSRYERMFIDIKNDIVLKIKSLMFTDIKELNFIGLLEPQYFARFSSEFPMELLNEINHTRYKNMFDLEKLKLELEEVYQEKSLRKENIFEFNIYFRSSGLNITLPEASKLSDFIVTLPLGPVLSDNFCSASSRIRQYLEDPLPRGMPQTGALLIIEKQFLDKLMEDGTFENHIIQDLAQKRSVKTLNYKLNVCL